MSYAEATKQGFGLGDAREDKSPGDIGPGIQAVKLALDELRSQVIRATSTFNPVLRPQDPTPSGALAQVGPVTLSPLGAELRDISDAINEQSREISRLCTRCAL